MNTDKLLALADKWKALADTPHDVADDYNAGQIWAYAVAQAQLREALAQPAEAVTVEATDLGGVMDYGFVHDTAQGAVAALSIALDTQQGTRVTLHRTRAKEILAALTHPQAAPAQGDGMVEMCGPECVWYQQWSKLERFIAGLYDKGILPAAAPSQEGES